jgi:hypothetical protein
MPAWRKSTYSDDGGGSCVEVAWRKSTYSAGGGSDCIEVALGEADVAVRDSKNPGGGVLRAPVHAWRRLVGSAGAE